MARRFRVAAFAAAFSFLGSMISGQAALAAPKPDDPSALLEAVKNGPHAKIGPWLSNLYEEYYLASGRGVGPKVFKTKNKALRVTNGMVGIDAYARNPKAFAASLRQLGATKIMTRGPLVSARVPVAALGDIAAHASLRYAQPVLAKTEALPPPPVFSQGDVSLNADDARAEHGVNGSGIRVGTLSDTFACNPPPFQPGAPTTTMAEDIANGDLPADTTILDNGPCAGAIDEGRAMAQLIHDVAPGAGILYHTAANSELDFAEGIIELQEAGAGVSADDVRYFAEPFFSDGMIAQAVDIVASRGVPHYSSAGNQARQSYENDFRGINVPVNPGNKLKGGSVVRRFHNFGTVQEPAILQPVFLQPDAEAGFTVFSFQWDQPHLRATTYARIKAGQDPSLGVGAESDLDMVFFDHKGHLVRRCPPGVSRGITCQITGGSNVGGDAVDIAALFFSGPPRTAQLFFIAFVLNEGPDPNVVKYAWFDIQGLFGVLDFDTESATSFGHSNAAGNQAIGAASWQATVPFSTSGEIPPNDTQKPAIDLSPCDPACLNDFSSAGGIPIYLDRFGNRLSEPEIRRVPSVTGPDNGNTSFFFSDSNYDDDDGDGLNSPFSLFISGLDAPGDEYPNFGGTSASTPHVAGVAALMLEKSPGLTVDEIRSTLQETARPITLRWTSARPTITFPVGPIVGPNSYSFDAGFGLVDAAAALDALD